MDLITLGRSNPPHNTKTTMKDKIVLEFGCGLDQDTKTAEAFKMRRDLIEHAVLAESTIERFIQEKMEEQRPKIIDQLNQMLIDKAREQNKTLYEVCASYLPDIGHEYETIETMEFGNAFKHVLRSTLKLVPVPYEKEEA